MSDTSGLEFRARMWDQWAAINDRISAQLPVGYEITFSLLRFDFAIALFGPSGALVPFPDPPNLDRYGSVFQILAAALEAAIAHDKANPT